MRFAGTMVGVGGAVGKAVAKSGIPPLQKAGLILGSSIVAGAAQVVISSTSGYFNGASSASTITSATSSFASNNNISKLVGNSPLSPIQNVLWATETMDYVCLGIIYILIIQLIFKLYFKDNVNLGLSRLWGNNFNSKTEFYLNKMIKLNKRISIFWIWFGFATVLFGALTSTYGIGITYLYLDKAINTHNPIINNIVPTLYKSIEDALFNLVIVNFIFLIVLISLIIILFSRFHYNKTVNTVYIWVLLVILITLLAYSGYISGELYTNIDSYVNIYNNLKTK
jgi:hypothetical protein